MPDLIVRIKKKNDGAAALACERPDGSVTWQRQDGHQGQFFPLHDLTHFAVESVLGLSRGFYGLVAGGWDIGSFGENGASGRLPSEALAAEVIVGFFDLERATGEIGSADDFNSRLAKYFADKNIGDPGLRLSEDQMTKIRAQRAELFGRWKDLPAGETLELRFQ